ncbi:MAG: peptidylprolyl isomerase [Chlamydiales bacterium]
MKGFIPIMFFSMLFSMCQSETKESIPVNKSFVTIRTTEGDFDLQLFADQAPITVKNFLRYVDEEHYNKTIFHRVISGFMIQGGGMTSNMKEKPTHSPIKNEASNKISNKRGTIAMARTSEVNSATSQFFINLVDNDFLDYRNSTQNGYGYCVFGQVTNGMDVIDKIQNIETEKRYGHQNVPIEPIEIIEIVYLK